ncbi:ring-cleaving dioxygenase [Chitinophaga sancti]|uniref:Glyoxalase family protein n=1 Tax=Chitinophaga sancti TaxID=1004 RepID=A0A1K1R2S9_9BACT|nr:ring-cleaving dioxygenase [Chitinophaga sancti]WQD64322.1 ring-cleaving dioxygenase [Chitinophaga sancti]WQG90054.1 ring-cleaving dioxygenase [Chitinophaga sancti]SFW66432.1 glyoxalase family protein [Chitinophaga sancti]
MEDRILGLHHITAIADNAKRNLDFYTNTLGVRFVKKTVNFDDPGTYHFYFGNETGTPGTILTFFPWEGIGKGTTGTGMATEIGYAVPEGSLEFWAARFKERGVKHGEIAERFGELYLPLEDPDGLKLNLIVPKNGDDRTAWETADVKAAHATKGFHNVTLNLRSIGPTATVLTEILGYQPQGVEGNRHRFVTDAIGNANIVDLIESPKESAGKNAAGTNHHVAFRVKNDEILMKFREKVMKKGLNITPKIDRDYFFSLYFREPGGVLFELATDNPGFTVDEPLEELGKNLKLPAQYRTMRGEIEKVLPPLQ